MIANIIFFDTLASKEKYVINDNKQSDGSSALI